MTENQQPLTAPTLSDKKEAIDLNRRGIRKVKKINKALYTLLAKFYTTIAERQLSEKEIRSLFTSCNNNWKKICRKNKLQGEAIGLFASEIKETWAKKDKKDKESKKLID